ncbi:hypothetical protein [Streptomyces millisiae]|uniref:Uncharacterized protein n=1 Tax=Streptomyces millisiae TaxID=3075542 RepID=A0ABU2LXY6_9ACTN|nr:hypothetical protein [Streptomyces sp. DSM 44918]MDT0322464.1 hypothetical protein [Streptomyces sp. DSM 44918]
MMSFLAKLLNGADEPYLYRVHLDGGERISHLLFAPKAGVIVSATESGEADGHRKLFLDSGELAPPTFEGETDFERGDAGLSREEFSRVALNIRREWMKRGEPPAAVVRTYG